MMETITDILASTDKTLILNFFIGITMLLIGHRVFWLFVGGMAYLYVFDKMTAVGIHPTDTIVAQSLFMGVLASLAAFFLQKFTLHFVGFFVGGVALITVMQSLGVEPSSYLFTFLAGALFGLIFFSYLFDWTMVLMSSWLGAAYLTNIITITTGKIQTPALFVLTVIGVLFQGFQLYRSKK